MALCAECGGGMSMVDNRLAEWRRLLRQSTTQARAVLQRVLRGRITFVPEGTAMCSLRRWRRAGRARSTSHPRTRSNL